MIGSRLTDGHFTKEPCVTWPKETSLKKEKKSGRQPGRSKGRGRQMTQGRGKKGQSHEAEFSNTAHETEIHGKDRKIPPSKRQSHQAPGGVWKVRWKKREGI